MVPDAETASSLMDEGWRKNPMQCDPPYETAPGTAAVPVSNIYEMDIGAVDELAQKDATIPIIAPTVTVTEVPLPRRRGPNKPKADATAGA